MPCFHIFVSGRVQGVAFRWAAQERAQKLGVNGWVRNRRDGRVELLIEGEDKPVHQMLDWLHCGPPGAHVTGVDFREAKREGLRGLEIRTSA